MKQITTRISLLGVAALLGGTMSSCTPTGTGPNTTVSSPSGVQLSNRNSTTVAVKWTRNSGDASSDTVIAQPASGAPVSVVTNSTDNTALLIGLTKGVTYTISVKGGGGTSEQVQWATAVREPVESNGADSFTLYETADPDPTHPSGLVLGDPSQTISGNDLSADIIFFSDGANGVFLRSGLAVHTGGKRTVFSDSVNYVTGGLDNIYQNTGVNGGIVVHADPNQDFNNFSVPLSNTLHHGVDKVFDVLTADNHYARIDLIADPSTGEYVSTTPNGRSIIHVRVSYQPIAGSGYVSRPGARLAKVAPKTGKE